MRVAIQVGLALLLAACGGINVETGTDGGGTAIDSGVPDGSGAPPDAASPGGDAASDAGPTPSCAWSELSPMPFAVVNGPDDEESATLTGDGRVVFFTAFAGSGVPEIFDAVRQAADQPFGASRLVPELNSAAEWELELEVSASGEEIFFAHLSADPILSASRASIDDPFGSVAQTGLVGRSPSLSGDGLDLYFADLGLKRILRASRSAVGEPWSDPVDVGSLAGYESIDVSSDELHLLMSRSQVFGPPTVTIATRETVDEPFGAPVSAGEVFDVDQDGAGVKEASWNGDETQIVVNLDLGNTGSDMYLSTCQ